MRQSPGDVKEESARRSLSTAGFPSGNHVRRECIVHGGCTGVHQQGEGSKALGKIAHSLGSLLPIRLRRVLVRGCGFQYADEGGEHRKGVGAEVDGEEVLCCHQTGSVRLKVVCAWRHRDEGVGRLASLLCCSNRGLHGVL